MQMNSLISYFKIFFFSIEKETIRRLILRISLFGKKTIYFTKETIINNHFAEFGI